ncbi:alkaline phosphatase family protein [Lacibacter luteus]|uniref:Alkaline phosphatase family protein n=1 Tax=Lacibacter luteus TaxID=2508719 RepID=A0A4Q1CED7_9BACT|nr:alkaline phosphatase family protein [Lacibacter luteus]RXK58139.1 alkaline phosphatase family protein [Lacibacter luteus]
MGHRFQLPPTSRWVLQLFVFFMLGFSIMRVLTFFSFRPDDVSFSDAVPSFLMGLRFDLRWVCILLSPILIAGSLKKFSPFQSSAHKKFWIYYLVIVSSFLLFFFGADFGHFDYVETRLNASALNFIEDFAISMSMLWQSYPLFWIFLLLSVIIYLLYRFFHRSHAKVHTLKHPFKPMRAVWMILLLVVGIAGFNPAKPLMWKDAFRLGDNFKAYLALNPLENFFTTLRFRKPFADVSHAKMQFETMKQLLQLPAENQLLDFKRKETFLQQPRKMNVVLVLCESLSMYKTSLSGNPLNATPYLQQLSNEGLLFERCFSPHFGTARGVFALLTGIPDVQLSKFSTRNEAAIDQHTIVNAFTEHEKFYFIGGNSEFNNFKGLLVQNVDGLHLFEEGMYKSPKFNVWGISDNNLFKEANAVLSQQTKPFFSIIQTADNHRPFVLPVEDSAAVGSIAVSEEELQKYGFDSQGELQVLRYTDYSIRQFMEAAKKEPWFENTLFVFVGDHGVKGNAKALYPDAWTNERLTDEHIPLLFYAPGFIKPEKRKEAVSQIDVLPTIAGLLNQPYTNTTIGRDLLRKQGAKDFAFIIHHDEGKIGLVNNDFYYILNMNLQKDTLIPVRFNTVPLPAEKYESIKKHLATETIALYESSRWMLLNNKK